MTKIDRLRAVLAEVTGADQRVLDGLTPTTRLQEDLGMDSLDVVEFIMALEDEFHVQISDLTSDHWKNWGQVMSYVQHHVQLHQEAPSGDQPEGN